jgi:hypothetical protein
MSREPNMREECREHRDAWIERRAGDSDHPRSCPACAAWTRTRDAHARALAGLARLEPVSELDRSIACDVSALLERTRARVEEQRRREATLLRGLAQLERLTVPAELEARLFSPEGGLAQGALDARALADLDAPDAPRVLDRLVAEELSEPEKRRAARFAGDLERQPAPPELAVRVETELLRPRSSRVLLARLAVAAAVLTLAIVGLRRGLESRRPARTLEVVAASRLAQLDPLAGALFEALSGPLPSVDASAHEFLHRGGQER